MRRRGGGRVRRPGGDGRIGFGASRGATRSRGRCRASGARVPAGAAVDPLVSMPSIVGTRGESGDDLARCAGLSRCAGFELHAWHHGRGGVGAKADRMAWLVGDRGVYYGHLDVAGHDPRAADTVLQNHSLVPFPHGVSDGESDGSVPLSMAPTRHHVLVAYARRLVAVNAVTGDLALDLDPVDAVNKFSRQQVQAQVQAQAQAQAGDTPGPTSGRRRTPVTTRA